MALYNKRPGINTDYLQRVYHVDAFVKTFDNALRVARQLMHTHPFDAIAFTGTSGAAYAYPLSYHLKVPLLCLRKNEKRHYEEELEGAVGAKRFLLVDDWIATGDTMKRMVSAIAKNNPDAQFSAILLWDKLERSNDDPLPPWHVSVFRGGRFDDIEIPQFGSGLPDSAYRTVEDQEAIKDKFESWDAMFPDNGYYSLDPA